MNEDTSHFAFAPEQVQTEWKAIFSQAERKASELQPEDWSHFTPQFVDTHSQEFNSQELFELMEQHQRLTLAEKISQPEANVKVEAGLPITVFMVGDIHSGSVFTNERLWQEHKKKIMETEGAYVMFLHNLVDNGMPGKFPDSMLTNAIPPHLQFPYMQKQLKELDDAGKVLAAIEGDCHEGWSWQKAGIPASNLLYGYEGRKFPVLENGGLVNLTVGKELYRIGLWHKQGPFNSNFNPEHSLRQNRRLSGRLTDVEVGAHHHTAVASNDWEGYKHNGQKVAYIRVGAYKGWWEDPNTAMNDRFVVDRWGKTAEPPGQSVLLYPFQHEVEATFGFDTGLEKHLAMRISAFMETIGSKQDVLELIKRV